MKVSELTAEQYRKYFEIRLQGKLRKAGAGYMANCPFHSDRHASMSVNVEKGVWRCHGPCNDGGGVIAFERKFLGGDEAEAVARIAEVIGEKQLHLGSNGKVVATYDYQDAYGRVIFQKLRYEPKRFVQRRVIDAKEGKYEYKLGDAPKPLYHLPEVLTSVQIWVCEGEKDCDNVRRVLRTTPDRPVTATTNFDGAGKWRDEYSSYLMGKQVIICADNDEAGEKHAEMVARSVYRYAIGVKLLRFPELPAKGDVSDFLVDHTAEDLIARVKATPFWKPPERDVSYFLPASKFAEFAPREIDWIIRGVLQRGVNGIVISRPKGGKSFTLLDLAVSIASGQDWLRFETNVVCRVGVVSREDWPKQTSWRLSRICEGRGLAVGDLDPYLYLNSKMQVPKLMLDNDADLQELMRQIEMRRLELVILDVFRRIHGAEENDNTEMQKIIDRLDSIQSQTGAQILLVHHTNKNEESTLTERARGAGAIAGWAEYVFGLSVVDDSLEYPIRKVEFELKAGNRPQPRYYQIVNCHTPDCTNHDDCACPRRLDVVDAPAEESSKKRRR